MTVPGGEGSRLCFPRKFRVENTRGSRRKNGTFSREALSFDVWPCITSIRGTLHTKLGTMHVFLSPPRDGAHAKNLAYGKKSGRKLTARVHMPTPTRKISTNNELPKDPSPLQTIFDTSFVKTSNTVNEMRSRHPANEKALSGEHEHFVLQTFYRSGGQGGGGCLSY